MSTGALAYRGGDMFPCDRITVAIFRDHDDDGQHDVGGFEIGIHLDLGCGFVVPKRVYNTIDVGS